MVVATRLNAARVRLRGVKAQKVRHARRVRKALARMPSAVRARHVLLVVAIRLSAVRVQPVVATRRAARQWLIVRTTALTSVQASQVAVPLSSWPIGPRASLPVRRPSVAVDRLATASDQVSGAHRASRSNKNGLPREPIFLS